MYTDIENWCGVSHGEIARREKARRRATARAMREAYRAMAAQSFEIDPSCDHERYQTEMRPDGTEVYSIHRDGQAISMPMLSILRR